MARAERVVFRLVATQKPAQTPKLLNGVQLITASSEDLVCIGLVPYIPDQPVIWRVKDVMHRDRQLDSAKACTGMPADPGTRVDDELPHFIGDLLQVLDPQLPQIGRGNLSQIKIA